MRKVLPILMAIIAFILLAAVGFFGYTVLIEKPKPKEKIVIQEEVTQRVVDNYGIDRVDDLGLGDVVQIYNYNFRIEGTLLSVPSSTAGEFNYIYEDGTTHTVTYTTGTGVTDILDAVHLFFEGEPESLLSYLDTNVQEENLEYYRQDTPEGSLAIIHNSGDESYNMFVPMGKIYVYIKSQDVLYLTSDAETVIFSNPADDPMTYHTYNMYEITAIENTRNELTDGTYEGDTEDLPTDISGTSATYTSAADNETRKQMLGYGNFTWDKNGKSTDTSVTIDLTSSTAKASEWVLASSSPYAFTNNSIKLHSLRATRNTDTFSVTGKVTNQLGADRPYVVVVKFLDSDSNLLGIRVVDKRNEPIPPNDVAEWSQVINSDTGVDLHEINALQFEVY